MHDQIWLIETGALQLRDARALRAPPLRSVATAALARPSPLSRSTDGYTAAIRVAGVLTRKPDPIAAFYGEANALYGDLETALAMALADTGVSEIVWSIDSPGGEVSGLIDLLDAIHAARGRKRMKAVVDNAHSAAYGLAAAVGKIHATSRMSSVGSVGVATSAFVLGEMIGQTVHLTNSAAPEKRPDVRTAEGKAVVVRYLDQVAGEFHAAIGRGRGVSASHVAQHYGRGSSMLAPLALKMGLIDSIMPRGTSAAQAITSRLPPATVARVEQIATATGQTRSAVIAEAVRAGLPEVEQAEAAKPARTRVLRHLPAYRSPSGQ